MCEKVDFGGSIIFGYTALTRKFVSLIGDGVPELQLGMKVTLIGDGRGFVPGGFSHGDEVTIVSFREPFKNGVSDHIIEVADKSRRGWVKPSNIQRSMPSD